CYYPVEHKQSSSIRPSSVKPPGSEISGMSPTSREEVISVEQ
ncbi:hypothetical protein AVEN_66612-1, partial [Araneus ventricosus]